MKVLICTDSFYPGVGGTEAACFGFASELVKQGHEVLLACPRHIRNDKHEYSFAVLRLPSMSVTRNDKMVFVKAAGKYVKQMLAFKPDIVHIETVSGMAQIGLKVGKKLGVPVVMTVHTKFRDAFSRSIKSKVIVDAMLKNIGKKLQRADAVLTVVDNTIPEIATWGYRGPIKVIRNGAMFEKKVITPEQKAAAKEELGLSPNENVLIFVGHMLKFKNFAFVLQALKKAVDRGFEGKLLAVGDGADLKYLQKLTFKLGIADKVIFTGQIKNRVKVAKMYVAGDLFTTASTFDTDPIVVVEAACMSVPSLVLEDTGCSQRIKDNVSGYLSAPDTLAFAERIIEIFSDKEKLAEVSANAREMVPSTWEDTVKEHLKLYESLLKENLAN